MDLIREVLQQVHDGKTRFIAESQAQDDLASFQPVASALKRAKELGYISAVFVESGMRDTLGFVKVVEITGPISHEGAQYLASATASGAMPVATSTENAKVFHLKPTIYGMALISGPPILGSSGDSAGDA